MEDSMSGKCLELLKEVAPLVRRVALLSNPATAPYFEYYLSALKSIGPSFSVEAVAAPVHTGSELEAVVAAQAREPNSRHDRDDG
jgi:putative tryptophan/tyrosine transport system substrate-binding protein